MNNYILILKAENQFHSAIQIAPSGIRVIAFDDAQKQEITDILKNHRFSLSTVVDHWAEGKQTITLEPMRVTNHKLPIVLARQLRELKLNTFVLTDLQSETLDELLLSDLADEEKSRLAPFLLAVED